jgi:hypothetical protein
LVKGDGLYICGMGVLKIPRIADNALVAIILMIAESKPSEKDVMVGLIENLVNKRN